MQSLMIILGSFEWLWDLRFRKHRSGERKRKARYKVKCHNREPKKKKTGDRLNQRQTSRFPSMCVHQWVGLCWSQGFAMLMALPNEKTNASATTERAAGRSPDSSETYFKLLTHAAQSLHSLWCQTVNRSTKRITIQRERLNMNTWERKTLSVLTRSNEQLVGPHFQHLVTTCWVCSLQVCRRPPSSPLIHTYCVSSAASFLLRFSLFVTAVLREFAGPACQWQTRLRQTGPTRAHLYHSTSQILGHGLTTGMVRRFCLCMIE